MMLTPWHNPLTRMSTSARGFIRRTNVIVAGQRYGWVIELRTKVRAVSVSEEYILPPLTETKPDPLAEALGLKNERRNQVSQRRLVPVEGKIYGEWEIGPQEPAGKRTLQVIVEGAEPVRFEYEVRAIGETDRPREAK